jgi:ATP-dependent RNA helicase DDX5/DBP2
LFTSDNSKQARELVSILREAGSPIDPKLAQMASYGGGGGHSRYGYGGGRGRGGGTFSSKFHINNVGGYRGGGRTGANNMPVGGRRW